jgi:hypothetical protein
MVKCGELRNVTQILDFLMKRTEVKMRSKVARPRGRFIHVMRNAQIANVFEGRCLEPLILCMIKRRRITVFGVKK